MTSRGASSLGDSVCLRLRAPRQTLCPAVPCRGSAPHPPPCDVGCVLILAKVF